MAMKTKLPYLLISQEKYPQQAGNGSSSMASPTRTGVPSPVTVPETNDSSLPLEIQYGSPKDVISEMMLENELMEIGYDDRLENGSSTEMDIAMLNYWDLEIMGQ